MIFICLICILSRDRENVSECIYSFYFWKTKLNLGISVLIDHGPVDQSWYLHYHPAWAVPVTSWWPTMQVLMIIIAMSQCNVTVSRSPGVCVSCLWGAWPRVRVICPGCLATNSGAQASPHTWGPSRGWRLGPGHQLRPGPGHQLRPGTPRQPEAMTSPAGRPGLGRTPETFWYGSTRMRERKKKMTSSMKSIRENHSTVFWTNSPEFYSPKNQLMIEF